MQHLKRNGLGSDAFDNEIRPHVMGNSWMGLQQSSPVEHPEVELKHASENYSLPELARLWSREAETSIKAVAKTLANAILSKALLCTSSDEIVYAFTNEEGVLQNVYLKEALRHMTIPGVVPTAFDAIDEAQTAKWIRNNLSAAAIDGDMTDSTLRLIVIMRSNFEAWLKSHGCRLPAFWFPVDHSVKTQRRAGNQRRDNAKGIIKKKAKTNAIYDAWKKQADELQKDNPARTVKDIAKEIAADAKLNPKGVNAETIRRTISARRG